MRYTLKELGDKCVEISVESFGDSFNISHYNFLKNVKAIILGEFNKQMCTESNVNHFDVSSTEIKKGTIYKIGKLVKELLDNEKVRGSFIDNVHNEKDLKILDLLMEIINKENGKDININSLIEYVEEGGLVHLLIEYMVVNGNNILEGMKHILETEGFLIDEIPSEIVNFKNKFLTLIEVRG